MPKDQTAKTAPDVAALGYEDARAELIGVVQALEAGTETLEASLALWERGEALATRCQDWLDAAARRLDSLRPDAEAASLSPDVVSGDDASRSGPVAVTAAASQADRTSAADAASHPGPAGATDAAQSVSKR